MKPDIFGEDDKEDYTLDDFLFDTILGIAIGCLVLFIYTMMLH